MKKGVLIAKLDSEKNENMTASFKNLSIHCTKRKDIVSVLEEREKGNIDPFKSE